MSILLVDSLAMQGGGQRMLVRLGSALSGFRPTLVRPIDAPEPDGMYGMPVIRVPFPAYEPAPSFIRMIARSSLGFARSCCLLARVARRMRSTCIIANDLQGLAACAPVAAVLRLPLAYLVHGLDTPRRSGVLLDRCGVIVCCSEAARRSLPPTRSSIAVVHNAVDLPDPLPDPAPLRREAGWDNDWICAWAGRMDANKNVASLVRAFARHLADLDSDGRRGRLLLIGDGPERPRIAEEAGRLGIADRVHCVGWVADPLPLLRTADALALPSLREAMPLALIEAQLLGIPALGVDQGGVSEILRESASGVLAASPHPDDLGVALVRLRKWHAGDPRLQASRDQAKIAFSPKRYALEIRNALKPVLPGVHVG